MDPIGPDTLRIDPHVGREMFGDQYTGTTTYGPSQHGSHNTMHNHFGKPPPLDPIIGELPDIGAMLSTHVPTGADGELDELLARRSTVCLVGPRNSGRYSTAKAALSRRHKVDHVYEIILPTDVSPEALVSKPARLPEHSGFILRLAGDGHADAIRKLTALFRQRDATLLLIKDVEPGRPDRSGAEVSHQAPDLIEVFGSHLAALLPEASLAELRGYLTQDVEAALKAAYGPRESVALAHAIARRRPTDERTWRDILNQSQPQRRKRAAAILLPGKDAPAGRNRRAGQHERAFRLTYAVFYRRPMHYVFEATDWLLREIDDAAKRPDWGSMALQHPVYDLLGDELGKEWEAGRDDAWGASRTAWIRDAGLRGAIVDIAWHEFDGTRKSLLRWLDRLVTEGDEVMRRAAAETAGLLVHHDFNRVHTDLVDQWAAARKADVRQAAAWTMTLSNMAGDVRPRVLTKLREWCSGSNNHQRATAARVYASGLEQPVLAWSMRDLARIAEDPFQKRRHVVAEAVNQLYRPERAGWIVSELHGWAETPLLQVHAIRSLLVLAARVEPDAYDGRPDLLQRLGEYGLNVQHLGRLWLAALLGPGTAPTAAHALARWIRHADANEELRPSLVTLLTAMVTTPGLRRRVEFYLCRTPELASGLPEWALAERRQDP